MLPKIVKAVDGRAKIIVDGGFLRGADICKGICAGADLVAMGRFVALGMAAGGEESLVRAFDLLLEEMHTVMVRCLPLSPRTLLQGCAAGRRKSLIRH